MNVLHKICGNKTEIIIIIDHSDIGKAGEDGQVYLIFSICSHCILYVLCTNY